MTHHEDKTRYPLAWPDGWKRTPEYKRKNSAFKVKGSTARDELLAELGRHSTLSKTYPTILSSNIRTRLDGIPYANAAEPADPGIAVYWTQRYTKKPMAIACDTYRRTWENMRAIHKTLEALRGIERWGASELLERAFAGFAALPDPGGQKAVVGSARRRARRPH